MFNFRQKKKKEMLNVVKKSKRNCREIAEQLVKTQAANVVKNEASLRAEYENFQGKDFKHLKRENHQNPRLST